VKAEKRSVTQTFTPVTRANYDRTGSGRDVHYSFKDGQRGMMSVTDVYAAVQAIGAADPGTLRELSFFSHAWHGGPILVNSTDDGAFDIPPVWPMTTPVRVPVGSARDPDDFDPRPEKDFGAPTMSPTRLKHFRDAYHPDGFSWSWGCAFFRTCHEILHKLEHHRDYRSSGMRDDDVLTFTNFRAEHVHDLEARLGSTFADPKKVELEFRQLKEYFCLLTVASYTHHLAVASARPAFGGLVGTYSEYDTGPLPLMHVHKGFAAHIRFYRSYLGFDVDPESRGYGRYDPGFTC
jgi:hypothetical protein